MPEDLHHSALINALGKQERRSGVPPHRAGVRGQF
jgi:hypothetical protein